MASFLGALGLGIVGLGVVSCSPEDTFDRVTATTTLTTATPTTATTTSSTQPEEVSPEVAAALGRLPGQLAVGAVNRLSLVSPDGSEVERLEGASNVLASQPTWSSDGSRLAWSRASETGHELVVLDIEAGTEVTSRLDGSFAFYLQWSAGDRGLAYLRGNPNGEGVEMGLAVPGFDASPVAVTEPFYLAWSPSGSNMAAHIADSQVIVLADLLEVSLADLDDPVIVLELTGSFTAPVWVDDSTLLVATSEGLTLVDVNSLRSDLLVDSGSPVQFVLSPDRSKVAYHVPGLNSGSSLIMQTQLEAVGGLAVLDLASLDTTVVTDRAPLEWAWSPDSRQLAWLDLGVSADRPEIRWQFWDGETSTPSAVYRVSQQTLQAYLPFFEQFAQSHSHWSPDSAAFAFAGRIGTLDGPDRVWVQLVGVDTPPIPVAEGDVVVWSH